MQMDAVGCCPEDTQNTPPPGEHHSGLNIKTQTELYFLTIRHFKTNYEEKNSTNTFVLLNISQIDNDMWRDDTKARICVCLTFSHIRLRALFSLWFKSE